MTRIFYDGAIYGLQSNGGISRYFNNIINRLPSDFTPILTSPRSSKESHPYHPNLKLFNYKRFGFKPGRLCYWLEPYYFQATEALSNYQIFHPTYYSLLTQQKFAKKSCLVVLTVYDMIHEIFSDSIDPNGEMAEIKRRAILSADLILCISEITKIDLLERYTLSEERVWVTHLATEFTPNFSDGDEFIPSRPFYLYVGGRNVYKNFDALLIAFSKIVSKVPETMLCVVGGGSFTKSEQILITELYLDASIKHFGNISDTHLAKLYRNCIAFVYPSLYEGFGIPPLEAMISQAPVIASNTSSIPEVVGDAGLLFDPTSIPDLVDRLLFLIDNPAERERLIIKGLEQAKKFSWDKTVRQTIEAYNFVAN